jgi:hypothetical protein
MEDFASHIVSLDAQSANGELLKTQYTNIELRNKIVAFEKAMTLAQSTGEAPKCDLNEVFPVRHIFSPGAYAREMQLPMGHWITGKIHKHAHLNFVTKGRVAVVTEDGVSFITAPYTFVSSVGTKRLVLVLEPTTWTTVHVTDKTDLEEIERDVIAKTFDDVPMIEQIKTKELL